VSFCVVSTYLLTQSSHFSKAISVALDTFGNDALTIKNLEIFRFTIVERAFLNRVISFCRRASNS
jgi:hypothetical protein